MRSEILATNFNLAIHREGSDTMEWVSFSRDDMIEMFEYTIPESGRYQAWRFADRDDWDSILSTSRHRVFRHLA